MQFPNKKISILFCLIIIINFISLTRWPPPNGDEAWMASRALEIIQSGHSFGALDRGVLDKYEGYENFNPWLSSAIQSLGIRVFGTPSLLAIRFVSMIVGFLLLIAVYWIGIALDGKKFGYLSVAITAFSWSFLASSHLGRPDIIAAAFGYASIALFLNNRSANVFLSFLVGLIVSLAFEVHPNGIVYCVTVVVLFIYRYKLRTLRRTDFWGFIGGGATGVLIFFSLHVFPNPNTYIRLSQIVFSYTHIPTILSLNPSNILTGLLEMSIMTMILFPQIIIGLSAIFRFRKLRPTYMGNLLVITFSLIISFFFLVPNKFHAHYAIHFIVALCIFIAAFFNELLKLPVINRKEYFFRRVLIISLCLIPMITLISSDSNEDYRQVQARVKQVTTPKDSIMGYQLYWFSLNDHRYLSWENLVFYRRDKPGSTLEDAFRSLRPDLFIIESGMRSFIFDGESESNYHYGFQIPKSELESFLNEYGILETTIGDIESSQIQIYRIHY